MTDKIKEIAPQILDLIKSSQNILLHLHPGPDADSAGSALALYFALKSLGKNPTVIKGDSDVDLGLSKLPGFEQVELKNYFEIDPSKFDLFIILDSSNKDMISKVGEINFPETMKSVVIDHHISNLGFADINLIEPASPATAQIVYFLIKEWNIQITPEMAACLYAGIQTDTGGFKYAPTSKDTFLAAADLAAIDPKFTETMFDLDNNNEPEKIILKGLALSHIETFFNNHVALALVSYKDLKDHGILNKHTSKSEVSNELKSVIGWDLAVTLFEKEPNEVSVNFRTRDANKYDLSKIALNLGGGGHKAAAGATISLPFKEAKQKLLETIKQTYPDLGNI